MATILTPSDRKLEVLSEAAGDLRMQYLWPDDPYVHMTEVPPGYEIALHSHSETDVTVILTGSARVGGAALRRRDGPHHRGGRGVRARGRGRRAAHVLGGAPAEGKVHP